MGDVPMWLLAGDGPRVGTLHTPRLPPLLVHIGHMHTHACTQPHAYMCPPHPTPPTHTHIWVLPGYQRLTYLFRKDSPWPTLASWRATSQIQCVFSDCRRHAKHWTVFNIQNNFSNMLLPRISLLGQIIQLSVCLLLIPKLGGGSTYHLFCRLVFSQNTTIKIALAVIKMAQRQIWRRAKTRGNEGGRGEIAGATFCHPMKKLRQ